jgi:BirA family biotin operon repressor/biotin-[acetyl-CoA-carboxylase] ligase
MVDQEHKALNDPQLENLFLLLVNEPQIEIKELSTRLQLDVDTILSMISTLNNMGLAIHTLSNKVTLKQNFDAIDNKKLLTQLRTNDIEKPLHYYFASNSTNQLARDNQTEAIYISDYQYAGKGRRKKQWLTPLAQSIALSISHDFDFSLQKLTGLNIAIGVAIINTAKHFGCYNLGLKWPNDVLANNGKVAGILIEASGNTQNCRAIIGIGLNWNIRQGLLDSIEQGCSNIEINTTCRSDFIGKLIIQVHKVILEFTNHGLKHLLSKWQANDMYSEHSINILQNDISTKAKYIAVNLDGSLHVEIDNQTQIIASGEVSIRKSDHQKG